MDGPTFLSNAVVFNPLSPIHIPASCQAFALPDAASHAVRRRSSCLSSASHQQLLFGFYTTHQKTWTAAKAFIHPNFRKAHWAWTAPLLLPAVTKPSHNMEFSALPEPEKLWRPETSEMLLGSFPFWPKEARWKPHSLKSAQGHSAAMHCPNRNEKPISLSQSRNCLPENKEPMQMHHEGMASSYKLLVLGCANRIMQVLQGSKSDTKLMSPLTSIDLQ